MPYELNSKIKNLTPYDPITGDYKIRLDANESCFALDSSKVALAFKQTYNRYPDPYAVSLCSSFARLYNVDSRYVTAGNGSDELISLIVGAFFAHGDTLLTLSNDFSMYNFYGEVFGIKTEIYKKDSNLDFNVDELISYINKNKIAGLVFSNPCNPTSLLKCRDDIIKLVTQVNALVVVDEAYMDFADQSILECCHEFDNVIVLKTCSKAIGMAAIRLGFAIANDKITQAIRAVKSPYNVNAVTQSIGEIVLNDVAYIKQCTAKIIENKVNLQVKLNELNLDKKAFEVLYNSSTNFVFIKTKRAKEIFLKLLEKSIAIRFMGEYLRISTGTKLENEELITALNEIL